MTHTATEENQSPHTICGLGLWMMTDYTPTTEEVWRAYINWEYGGAGIEFDRWLAEVKAQAWQEGYESVTITTVANPYREHHEPTS